ncbi:MAG: adenylate/guanylate cyclase domain-containing protein [Spirochaetes bacterium]|nr:adenylate/guanylate cyclase domain-containing protein [Spirochaetota bacterium]
MGWHDPVNKFKGGIAGFKDDLERDIEIEIMKSDRIRSLIIFTIFVILATGFFGYASIGPKMSRIDFKMDYNPWFFVPIAYFLAIFEFAYSRLVGIYMRKGLMFPKLPRYLNAFIELAFPTLLLYSTTQSYQAYEALSMPPASVYLIVIALSVLRLDMVLTVFSGIFAAIQYLFLANYLGLMNPAAIYNSPLSVPSTYFARSFLFIFAGIASGFVAYQINQRLVNLIKSREEKNKIAAIFGQHVSHTVMEKLTSGKTEIINEIRNVCVMFLDIRNFTAFSQNRKPEEVVDYLNSIFDFMIDSINQNDGMINKFLGDGFMAVFGAPISKGNDVKNAINASMQIIDRIQKDSASGVILPTMIGIGLHCGKAITGNIGSKYRKEYTVIGDVVNIASRIEQLNKQYQSCVLVSEDVFRSAGASVKELEMAINHGPVPIKGRDKDVVIYQLR